MDGPLTTRYSLIAQLVDRDDHVAWSQFLDLYQPLIYRFALSRGLQATDATEVTQEVLIRVAKAIEQFDRAKSGPGFRQWLYTIARNLTVDFLRKERRHSQDTGRNFDWQSLPAPDAYASQCFQTLYQREIFMAAARWIEPKVKPINWQAFWLSEVEQLPVEVVVRQLKINRAAVYVARSRILNMFRRYVQDNEITSRPENPSHEDRHES